MGKMASMHLAVWPALALVICPISAEAQQPLPRPNPARPVPKPQPQASKPQPLAESKAPAASISAPAAQHPRQTTAVYDDWIFRCETIGDAQTKVCEIAQAFRQDGAASIVAQIAIGRLEKNKPLRVIVQTPVDVWLPAGVKLQPVAKDAPIAIEYKLCRPSGCQSDIEIPDDIVRKWRMLTDNGAIVFQGVNQMNISIPLSFKGFAPAFDAMIRG